MSNSYRTTVTEGLRRAAMLTPFATRSASNLRGDCGAVCSHIGSMPERFRDAQSRRHHAYMTTGSRNQPADAVRYFVTSYGVPIAWVTLDGRTHYAQGWSRAQEESRAMLRHQAAIRASWPDRFVMDSQGDPQFRRYPDGTWQPLPAETVEV